jgi:hypothetical protein
MIYSRLSKGSQTKWGDDTKVSEWGHLPVRKKLHAKEGFCGHLARLRLSASGDPIELIPRDDVRESIQSSGFYRRQGNWSTAPSRAAMKNAFTVHHLKINGTIRRILTI